MKQKKAGKDGERHCQGHLAFSLFLMVRRRVADLAETDPSREGTLSTLYPGLARAETEKARAMGNTDE